MWGEGTIVRVYDVCERVDDRKPQSYDVSPKALAVLKQFRDNGILRYITPHPPYTYTLTDTH